jgi:hypothetical protein
MVTGLLSFSSLAHAHCPLCALAVGTGAVAAQYYGMGLSAIGAFVGGAGVVMGLMVMNKIPREYVPHQKAFIVGGSFLLTILTLNMIPSESLMLPILWVGEAGSLLNKAYWLDKALLGSVFGGIATLVSHGIHEHIKKSAGKSLIPFQGVIATVLLVALTAGILQWAIP